MASAHLVIAGVLVLAVIAHAAILPAIRTESAAEEQARELLSSLMEKAEAEPAMETKEEEEEKAPTEEEAANFLESLRSLLSERQPEAKRWDGTVFQNGKCEKSSDCAEGYCIESKWHPHKVCSG